MGIRRAVSKAVGLLQIVVGGGSMVFAVLSFYNVSNIQGVLGFSGENMELYMLVFIVSGLLSVISGLFLSYER